MQDAQIRKFGFTLGAPSNLTNRPIRHSFQSGIWSTSNLVTKDLDDLDPISSNLKWDYSENKKQIKGLQYRKSKRVAPPRMRTNQGEENKTIKTRTKPVSNNSNRVDFFHICSQQWKNAMTIDVSDHGPCWHQNIYWHCCCFLVGKPLFLKEVNQIHNNRNSSNRNCK